jgi:hypothetical protein
MLKHRIPQQSGEGEREIRECAECGASSHDKTLMLPRGLKYAEKRNYTGPRYCVTHCPGFAEGLDLVAKLTNTPAYKPFGGDAA